MKIADIVGARPQFIKLTPVLRAIGFHNQDHPEQQIEEILIHTGQHYDYERYHEAVRFPKLHGSSYIMNEIAG